MGHALLMYQYVQNTASVQKLSGTKAVSDVYYILAFIQSSPVQGA